MIITSLMMLFSGYCVKHRQSSIYSNTRLANYFEFLPNLMVNCFETSLSSGTLNNQSNPK
jgi:hypothetical protein